MNKNLKIINYTSKVRNRLSQYRGEIYEKYIYDLLKEDPENEQVWYWKDMSKENIIKSKLLDEDDYLEIYNYTQYIFNMIKIRLQKNDMQYYPLARKYLFQYLNKYTIIDIGIDIVIKKRNFGEYIFIQCKNKQINITQSCLKSFHNLMNTKPYLKGILYSSSPISKKVNKLQNVEYIHKMYNDINYDEIHEKIIQKINNYGIIKDATDDIIDNCEIISDLNISININKNEENKCGYGELKWAYHIMELEKYILNNNNIPSIYDKNSNKLYTFLSDQFKLIMINDKYYKSKEWINYVNRHKLLQEKYEEILEKFFCDESYDGL